MRKNDPRTTPHILTAALPGQKQPRSRPGPQLPPESQVQPWREVVSHPCDARSRCLYSAWGDRELGEMPWSKAGLLPQRSRETGLSAMVLNVGRKS